MSAVKKKKNFLSTRLVLAVKKDDSDDAEMKLTFFFCHTSQLAGSQFSDQGSNPGHHSESS